MTGGGGGGEGDRERKMGPVEVTDTLHFTPNFIPCACYPEHNITISN